MDIGIVTSVAAGLQIGESHIVSGVFGQNGLGILIINIKMFTVAGCNHSFKIYRIVSGAVKKTPIVSVTSVCSSSFGVVLSSLVPRIFA